MHHRVADPPASGDELPESLKAFLLSVLLMCLTGSRCEASWVLIESFEMTAVLYRQRCVR